MPRNINFIKNNLNKALKKPMLKKTNLRATRDFRLIVRNGAITKTQVSIIYKKVTTGQVKRYEVCPMSYRYRRLRSGVRKVLFAMDSKEKQLKMFVLKNVRQAMPTTKKYIPIKYPIEIK